MVNADPGNPRNPYNFTSPNSPTSSRHPTEPDRPTESDLTRERARERAVDLAWERALELAWESFCGGTTPVGAVVTDAAGAIVAGGRGRRFEPATQSGGWPARRFTHCLWDLASHRNRIT